LGHKIIIDCDGCRHSYSGRVSYISPAAEYTPPVIYSESTNEKLIYRIEADFGIQDATQWHPGQPVRVIY
jgi:HlyD family secretion protein